MKPIALLFLFVAGSMANSYAPVRVSYGTQVANSPVISYGSPPPAAPPVQSYSPPPPPAAPPVQSYSAPAPAAPVQSYGSSYGSSSGSLVREHIPITRYNAEFREGHHSHEFQTGNGIQHQETTQIHMNPSSVGLPDDANHGKAHITKTGSYSYTTPEGHNIELRYVADKDGFRATGAHLPTPPPIPAEIQESLRLIANAPVRSQTGDYGYSAPPPASPPVQSYGGYSPAPAPAPASPPMRVY